MMKPRDFGHWTHWLRWEWREWNPLMLSRKIRYFTRNVWAYRVVLWRDQDCDYACLLSLMELKLRRMSRHFAEHGIVVGSDRTARECLIAAELCRRIHDDEYYFVFGEITKTSVKTGYDRRQDDVDYLARLISKKLLSWWD